MLSMHSFGLTSLCVQEVSACVAMLRIESMFRAGKGMKVARALLLLGVDCLGFFSVATAQNCTTGSKAVAVFTGVVHACALLVSKSPPLG